MLLLVVPLLPGRSRGGGTSWNHQSHRRMADLSACATAHLLGVPLLPSVSRAVGGRKRSGRSGKAARGRNRVAQHADDRGTGARHRSQRSHHAYPSAARAHLRCRGRQGTEVRRGADRGAARGCAPSRYRQTRGARADHQQARTPDAGRVRKNEGASHRGSGNSGAGRVSLSGRTHCALPPRTLGWVGISRRTRRRTDPDRRAHSGHGRLPGRAGLAPPIPPRFASG